MQKFKFMFKFMFKIKYKHFIRKTQMQWSVIWADFNKFTSLYSESDSEVECINYENIFFNNWIINSLP